jgi:hypothetical protein
MCGGKGELLYFGAFHTVDANNFQIKEIEKIWQKFNPTLVFSEGGIWPLADSSSAAVNLYGEPGLLRFMADRYSVPIRSFEPRRIREVYHLLKYFSGEQIKMFYILRQAVVYRGMGWDMKDLRFAEFLLENLLKLPQLCSYPWTMAQFEERFYQLFPEIGDWRYVPDHWFSAKFDNHWLNLMSKRVNDYRNQHMVRVLMNALKKGGRIFAVAGRSHVVMQEPVLRNLIQNL